MPLSMQENTTLFLWPALTVIIIGFLVRGWYFQWVRNARQQVKNLTNGNTVPGKWPTLLIGNIPDIYRANNRLVAYNALHKQFGAIFQLFWLWRPQISISDYRMARQVLMVNQRNYEKSRPNSLLQMLFGKSILTSTGQTWKRQRLLMNEAFSKKRTKHFHQVFVDYSKQLVHKWSQSIDHPQKGTKLNTYPDLTALFLDIIGKTTIGKDFAALEGEFDEFLDALKYIEHQSTQPIHQFCKWWKHLPLPASRRLKQSFRTIDAFLYQLIHQRQKISASYPTNILDLLLQATDSLGTDLPPLTEKEVRDNLVAIMVNGHDTVATTVAMSLHLLAQHPEKMVRVQAEVDQIIEQSNGQLTEDGATQLNYLNCVLLEVLRYAPAVAGLQRTGKDRDVLGNWSTPPKQLVGIALEPLHHDPNSYGSQAEQFHPERYLNPEAYLHNHGDKDAEEGPTQSKCPFSKLWMPLQETLNNSGHKNKTGIQPPLTFGDGARKCLGEHFAMYEMKVALAILLYHFDFQVAPGFDAELELGKLGFLSTLPKNGVEMIIRLRTH